MNLSKHNLSEITLGAGCFWCVDAVFKELKGVTNVEVGYANGFIENPSYYDVCTGMSGFVEVAQITFDPTIISLNKILEIFWKTHDPTTIDQQGADTGPQYRSGIYYKTIKQKELAEKYKSELDKSEIFNKPIVTEIEPLECYYKAENYHQHYFSNNQEAPYCKYVILPKISKLVKLFGDLLID